MMAKNKHQGTEIEKEIEEIKKAEQKAEQIIERAKKEAEKIKSNIAKKMAMIKEITNKGIDKKTVNALLKEIKNFDFKM